MTSAAVVICVLFFFFENKNNDKRVIIKQIIKHIKIVGLFIQFCLMLERLKEVPIAYSK